MQLKYTIRLGLYPGTLVSATGTCDSPDNKFGGVFLLIQHASANVVTMTMLIGNKCDMEDRRLVSREDGAKVQRSKMYLNGCINVNRL